MHIYRQISLILYAVITEIESEYTREILNIRNYRLELENNSVTARVGIYINETLSYVVINLSTGDL